MILWTGEFPNFFESPIASHRAHRFRFKNEMELKSVTLLKSSKSQFASSRIFKNKLRLNHSHYDESTNILAMIHHSGPNMDTDKSRFIVWT